LAVHDHDNVIELEGAFDHPAAVRSFSRSCKWVIEQRAYEDVVIRIRNVGRCFPNAEVPIAAIVDYYKQRGVDFLIDEDRWSPIHFAFEPFSLNDPEVPVGVDPISRIWRFTESSATPIADAIARSLLERLALEEGVFKAINWCLYEIMDNVLQHSESEVGFVEAQVHRTTQRVAICIADAGIGFRRSFRNSRHRMHTESDAITLSVQERLTRDSQVGAGNGLWGLYQIVTKNDGLLSIHSGRGTLHVQGAEASHSDDQGGWWLSDTRRGAVVDFQLPVDRPIDVSEALGMSPVDSIIESFESEGGESRVKIADGHGTATRRSGIEARNLVVNLLRETHRPVVLDFDGVGMTSASFADELVGKLAGELGPVQFMESIRLENMDSLTRNLVNRAIAHRLAPPPEPDRDADGG
jgi:hypothetical protein